MTIAPLLAELRNRDIQVWADGERLQCNAPAGALTPELREQLLQRRSEILEFLRGPAELSFSQERLWFLDQIERGGAAYVMALALEMRGALDISALERALGALVSRHESLRTVFANIEGKPLQVVLEPAPWALPVADVSGEAEARERLREETARGFDLARGPLFRAQLYRLAADVHVLTLAMHHIISDGWSLGILTRELGELYGCLSRGEPAMLPALPLRYRDFARWQRSWLQGETLEAQLSHWRARLAGAPQVLELPTDRPRAPVRSQRGKIYTFTLPLELADALRGLARREGATLFMTLLAGFTLLLSRHSGQQDILVGTPVANRIRAEIEEVVGCFVNTLVLRADLSGDPSASGFLARLREVCLDAFAHQDLPFERLVEELRPERDLSRNPLFQVMFALQNAPQRPLELPGITLRPFDIDRSAAQVDLTLHVWETAEGLSGSFEYTSELFEESTIARMATHWRSLLEGMIASPERCVWELPLLGEAERRQVLTEWNQTAVEYERDSCVHELFEVQAERTPQAIAVRFEGKRLTYQELDRRSNQLAHHLRKLGVGPEVLVGICMERSLEMVVGLLGILKAGGAYVPIDPSYPAARQAFMLQDSQAKVLLTQARLLPRMPSHSAAIMRLDADWHRFAAHLPTNPPPRLADPTHLAYVIYTSGSTGQPKGVCIAHRGLVNYLSWAISAYKVAEGTGAPVHSSLAFDLTVTSIFTPLLAGRAVELLSDDPGAEALASALRIAAGYSLVKLTPAHLQALQLHLRPEQVAERTRTFVIGGEQLRAEAIAFWRQHAPRTLLVNEYGPTETVVGCCVYTVTPETRTHGPIPIGRPIANTRLYILDRFLQPVPIGVTGELCIGGDGVARGYLNRSELTKERFIADPFSPGSGTRLYRTGDFARYMPDGNIEFLGRRDDQVKVSGFRIELGEIEAVLGRLPQVREAVVTLREDDPGERRLVAYVVLRPGHADAPPELRSLLKQHLPDHMLPSAFVTLKRLPLTPNGKVDRAALPAPDFAHQLKEAFVPPRTEWELRLAHIWRELLRVERVGVDDNFFALGGNSLMIVRLISQVSQRHQLSLRVVDFFRNPTVGQLARLIDAQQPRSRRQPAVVHLQKGQAEPPVYFIYAGPDEFRLAKLMDARHAVFGLEAPWPLAWRDAVAGNRKSGFPTMEQLVAPYVAALSAHAGASPCVLAGHSFAGLMAFEAAHQFQRQGGKVEMVMLLDTWATPPIPYRIAWHQWRQDWKQAPSGSHLRSFWRVTRWLLGQEKYRVWSFFNLLRLDPEALTAVLDEEGVPLPGGMLGRVYKRIGASYRPRRLDSQGVLFRTDQINGDAVLRDDDSLGWNDLFTRGLEIIPMVGDHLSMIRSHHSTLAREMNEVLKRYWAEHDSQARAAVSVGRPDR